MPMAASPSCCCRLLLHEWSHRLFVHALCAGAKCHCASWSSAPGSWSQPANRSSKGAWARTRSQRHGASQPASKPARRHSLPRALLLCVCVHAGAPTGTRRLLAASPLHHREGGCQELEGFAPAKGGCQEQLAAKSFAHGSDTQRALRLQKGLCGCQGVRGCQEVD